jgi:hypothetical protein
VRKTIGEYAKEYLQSKGFNSVQWGDSMLLHEIAEYAELKHQAWKTEKQILDALDRSKFFWKSFIRIGNRDCRRYTIKKEYKLE